VFFAVRWLVNVLSGENLRKIFGGGGDFANNIDGVMFAPGATQK